MTAGAAPVAVFDMDGVLVHGDAFGTFVREHLRRSPAHLAAVAGAWPWLLAPTLAPPTRRWAVGRLLKVALAGFDDAGYDRAPRRFGAELATRADRVVPEAVAAARALVADGHRVIVSTACEERMARAYVDGLGLDDLELVGTTIGFGRLGVHPVRENHGRHKVEGLQALGVAVPWAVSYSDALGDLPLLRSAQRAVLVNPDDWLRSRITRGLGRAADEVDWPRPARAPRAARTG